MRVVQPQDPAIEPGGRPDAQRPSDERPDTLQDARPLPSRARELDLLGRVPLLDDAGRETLARYKWQAGRAAVEGLRLFHRSLIENETIDRRHDYGVLCEWHEDAVVLGDGPMELLACKHRGPSRGAYRTVKMLADDGGLTHLFATWSALDQVPMCRLVTTGGLAANKPVQDFQAVCSRTRRSREAGEVVVVGAGDLPTIKMLHAAIADSGKRHNQSTMRRWQGDGSTPEVPESERYIELARFLSTLTIEVAHENMEVLNHVAPTKWIVPVLDRLGLGKDKAGPVWRSVLHLFETCMVSGKEILDSGLGADAPGSGVEDLILRRLITMDDIRAAITSAIDRAAVEARPGPFRGTPVRECQPRRLGVRAAIQVDGAGDVLPQYALRDVDTDLRAALRDGAQQGCFVLLLGQAAVGKTRTLFEAVSTVLPDRKLFHPDGPAQLRAYADASPPSTIVWVDGLTRYLGGPDGVTAGAVRALLEAGSVIVGTMWPEDYHALTAIGHSADGDHHADERDVLELANIITVATELSQSELDRVHDLAYGDPQWRAALASSEAGPIQVLAAGPALLRQWDSAPPYAKEAITFAVDARRLGVVSPLTEAALQQGIVGYLTSRQQATASPGWLRDALAHATEIQYKATSALVPLGGRTIGSVAGYVCEDFLLQYGRRTRRTVCPPTSFWQALTRHVNDMDDLRRLAYSADVRWRYNHAEPLYRRLSEAGDHDATMRLAELLIQQNRSAEATEVLQARTEDAPARALLARLLAELGRVGALSSMADDGDWIAACLLVELLAARGDIDTLDELAAAGDRFAAGVLADPRSEPSPTVSDRTSEVDASAHADTASENEKSSESVLSEAQVRRYASMLIDAGDLDGAIEFLEACEQAHAESAEDILADVLANHGRVDQLRGRARSGEWAANHRLAQLFAAQDQQDELQAAIDDGNTFAAWAMADLLVARGRLDEALDLLRNLSDEGDELATIHLNEILAAHGRTDELEQRAANDQWFTGTLIDHWIAHDELGKAEAFLSDRMGLDDEVAAGQLAQLWDNVGRTDDALDLLRPFTLGYSGLAVHTLVSLLDKHGRADDLRREADAGADGAAQCWLSLEVERGRISPRAARSLRAFGFAEEG